MGWEVWVKGSYHNGRRRIGSCWWSGKEAEERVEERLEGVEAQM